MARTVELVQAPVVIPVVFSPKLVLALNPLSVIDPAPAYLKVILVALLVVPTT